MQPLDRNVLEEGDFFDAARLVEWFRPLRSVLVAFSGGVDSAVVARAALAALGSKALAVTAQSPAVASGEIETACALAADIGMTHRLVATNEWKDARYQANDQRRCYYCKSELYGQLSAIAKSEGIEAIVSGTNADDLGDYRPGLNAAKESNVRHPLAELGCRKSHVRYLARFWNLAVSEKPASPCLASRIAYGEEVNPERLLQIDQAEQFLRSIAGNELRVRWHRDGLARIEVPLQSISLIASETNRQAIVARLREIGFRYVTIDLAGFRSGSLNESIAQEQRTATSDSVLVQISTNPSRHPN